MQAGKNQEQISQNLSTLHPQIREFTSQRKSVNCRQNQTLESGFVHVHVPACQMIRSTATVRLAYVRDTAT